MNVYGMITTQKSESYTLPALKSFFKLTPLRTGEFLLLIDNDNSFQSSFDHPQLKILKNSTPKSFAANGNTLIDAALSKHANLVFMNNDLIFTPNWSRGLEHEPNEICTPLSNAEVQYALGISVVANQNSISTYVANKHLNLSDYQGHEYEVAAIGAAHSNTTKGNLPVLYFPFFCVYMPYDVLSTVGHFDERFGIAGGEDFDYCVRASYAGFTICYKLNGWVLHFGGKSTWSAEELEAKKKREQKLLDEFKEKWGEDVFNLVLLEKSEILQRVADESLLHTGAYFTDALQKLLDGREVHIKL